MMTCCLPCALFSECCKHWRCISKWDHRPKSCRSLPNFHLVALRIFLRLDACPKSVRMGQGHDGSTYWFHRTNYHFARRVPRAQLRTYEYVRTFLANLPTQIRSKVCIVNSSILRAKRSDYLFYWWCEWNQQSGIRFLLSS